MIDEKYSALAFEGLGLDSDASKARTEELEIELLEEVQSLIENRLAEIVEKLNALGHNLRLEDNYLGAVSYRDDCGEGTHYECKLRIALDYVASSGYSHLLTPENFDAT